jgi:hypothetical protein
MSGKSTDLEHVPSENRKRSRSLLCQFREKFVGRSGSRTGERRIKKTSTPVSSSHRLSLFNQVKIRIIGRRKCRRTATSTSNDDDDGDYLSLKSVISITVSY